MAGSSVPLVDVSPSSMDRGGGSAGHCEDVAASSGLGVPSAAVATSSSAAPCDWAGPSNPTARSASASPTFWSKIGDRKPQQSLFKGDVDFTKYPRWFLADGHPLGHSVLTKNLTCLCTPQKAQELILLRPFVDWRRTQPMLKYAKPYTKMVDVSLL